MGDALTLGQVIKVTQTTNHVVGHDTPVVVNVPPVVSPTDNPPIATPPTPKPTGNKLTISDDDIVKAYSAVSGFDASTGLNDNGAVLLDVLNYWRTNGIAGHKIAAFTQLNPKNIKNIKAAIYLFGGIYVGVALPISAQKQDIWDVPATGLTGDGAVGSWGGHAICATGYDTQYVYCISWGKTKKMTWAFWKAYVDEAYVVISNDFATTKSPNGFDMSALLNDVQALSQ